MADEEKLQEKYIEMKMIEEHIKQLQEQLSTLEQQLGESMTARQSLDEVGKTDIGEEILVPLTQGVFVRATLKDNKDFLVNVGASTVVKKDLEGTKRLMENQI